VLRLGDDVDGDADRLTGPQAVEAGDLERVRRMRCPPGGHGGQREDARTRHQALRAGEVLVAPGDFHVRLVAVPGGVRIRLDQGSPENFCRPAVDVLFRTAAQVYGGRAVAVVLTGMGHDGLEGVRALTRHGARVLVQDEATSVVWGMPGAIALAGLADETLPLPELPARMVAAVGGGALTVR
jgi:chemotaxis response regulator CheB